MEDDFVEPGSGTADTETKPQTFGEAFKSARSAGDKTFMWRGKKYTTEMAGGTKRSSAPVPGRPRGESGPVSTTRQMADRAASDAMNTRAASETRAAKARESESEMRRESRGKDVERKTPRLSTAGLNPKTLLPEQRYAKGGPVRGGGREQRGKTRGKFV
jgi:hypothetical protein